MLATEGLHDVAVPAHRLVGFHVLGQARLQTEDWAYQVHEPGGAIFFPRPAL